MTGEFHSRTYSDHPDCTCPHGIKGTDPGCQVHRGPVGWLLASTACPRCRHRNVVLVRPVLTVKPIGSFSLSGNQVKVAAAETWEYMCSNCGAAGQSDPKEQATAAAGRALLAERAEPRQTCTRCGQYVTVVQADRGFPPDIAKRKLKKLCEARDCPSEPQYTAGVIAGPRPAGQ